MLTPLTRQLIPLARRSRPIPSGFSSSTVAGQVFWLDGADGSTITQSSGSISQWNDKSGSGHTATASGSAQPIAVSSVQNGHSIVRFDGAANAMLISLALSQPYSLFFVAWCQAANNTTPNGSSPNTILEVKNLSTGNFVGFHFAHFAGPTNLVAAFDGTTRQNAYWSSTIPAAQFNLRSDIADVASRTIYENRSLGATDSTVLSAPNTSDHLLVGSEFGGNNFQGDLAELLIYSRTVTSTERGTIETYLRSKWATP